MRKKKMFFNLKVTPAMVGLTMQVRNAVETEFNEYTINVKFKEISDEGLDLFKLTEEDCQA